MADIHVIRDTNPTDIAAMLRERADKAGGLKSAILVTVDETGEVETYGYGRTDMADTIATLQIASFKLCRTAADG